MNHFYEDLEGWFNFKPQYEMVLDRIPDNGTIVEVGSYLGKSLAYLVVENINQKKNLKIHSVDLWGKQEFGTYNREKDLNLFKDTYDKFLENTNNIKEKFIAHRMISWEAANLFEDNSIDYVFIDAAHDEHSVYKDICAWWPKVAHGGIIGGDDYLPGSNQGVRAGLEKFAKENNISYELMRNYKNCDPKRTSKNKSWYITKDV